MHHIHTLWVNWSAGAAMPGDGGMRRGGWKTRFRDAKRGWPWCQYPAKSREPRIVLLPVAWRLRFARAGLHSAESGF